MSLPNAGGPACRTCVQPFDVKPWNIRKADYECPRCKRTRQNAANRMDTAFKTKRRARNALPHVKQYLAEYQRQVEPIKRSARRKVRTEIEAGRLHRMPCSVCADQKSEAHHEDYSRPLDIVWLCRRHHVLADAMLAERAKPKEAPNADA